MGESNHNPPPPPLSVASPLVGDGSTQGAERRNTSNHLAVGPSAVLHSATACHSTLSPNPRNSSAVTPSSANENARPHSGQTIDLLPRRSYPQPEHWPGATSTSRYPNIQKTSRNRSHPAVNHSVNPIDPRKKPPTTNSSTCVRGMAGSRTSSMTDHVIPNKTPNVAPNSTTVPVPLTVRHRHTRNTINANVNATIEYAYRSAVLINGNCGKNPSPMVPDTTMSRNGKYTRTSARPISHPACSASSGCR